MMERAHFREKGPVCLKLFPDMIPGLSQRTETPESNQDQTIPAPC
jgi:hypothetical protein